MRVLLIDIDSLIPNLALKKIEKYHLDKGDEVLWNMELMRYSSDKVYVSCIFDWNKPKCNEWRGCVIGGSGYSLDINLPKEIDEVKPRINMGFTSRGCIRNCYFCIVPKKEGKIRPVGDIYDIWDGKSEKIVILDNNILAIPEHFKLIMSQLRKEKLVVDFNQGLDHRLLTDELCRELVSVRHKELRFAFDDLSYTPTVIKAINILKRHGRDKFNTRWYVYVGEKDTFDTVYERLIILKENRQGAYLMRDKKVYSDIKWKALSCWANMMGAFKTYDFFDLIEKSKRMSQYKELLSFRNVI